MDRILRERYKYTPIQTLLDATQQEIHPTPCTIEVEASKELYRLAVPQITPPAEWANDPIIQANLNDSAARGVEITIPANTDTAGVIEIDLRHSTDTAGHSTVRSSITLGDNSRARLVVRHHGSEQSMAVNALLDITLGRGATLEFVEIAESRATLWLTTIVQQQQDSHFQSLTIDLDNRTLRRNQIVALSHPGATSQIEGLYITSEGQSVDNHISMLHNTAHCTSSQLYKGIVGEGSIASFTGHIHVATDAQKSVALQQNHNILLGDNARINSRPQLEIYADDVKCNHGATVGRVDPEAIYYMRQRGIDEPAARRLQLEGFMNQIIENCPVEQLQHSLREAIAHRLQHI